MGAVIAESDRGFTKVSDGKTSRDGERTSGTSTSAADTTVGGGRTRGSGDGRSGGTGTATTGEQSKELSELAILTEDEKSKYYAADETEQKKILKNAKRRKQYAEKKANGGQGKPRKVRGKAKEQPEVIDKASLNMIVASLSAIVASRPNCEHWALTETEINSITDPLSKMLAESEAFSNLGQYSNQIALVMACVTIIVPRMIISIQKSKEMKQIARTGQRTNTNPKSLDGGTKSGNPKQTKASDHVVTGRDERDATSNGTKHADNVPFYGLPIC